MDNNEELIEKAKAYIKELFAGNSGGHDAEHTLRVYRNAMLIADEIPSCSRIVAALAALLHDADDPKLFKTENNANAREFLAGSGVGQEDIERICLAINSVSFSKNRDSAPASAEGMIVRDADRLDAIGAVGIARTFAYGGEHGRSLSASVEHFYEKLLLLKDMMNTEPAKRLAEKRHAYLVGFLAELDDELGN